MRLNSGPLEHTKIIMLTHSMKTLKMLVGLLILSALISSCDNDADPPYMANAEIIGFNSEKCACCWGWVIRVDSDTIRADELPNSERIGTNITKPIPVYIELGEKKLDCSTISTNPVNNKSFYKIKQLLLIQ